MLMAAFGDVCGSLPALRAVLDAVDEAGIHTIVNAGNSVAGGPQPNEVIGLLRERAIPSVQGIWDRRTVRFVRKRATLARRLSATEFDVLERTYDALHCEELEFLRGLPQQRVLEIEGLRVFLCHGAPGSPSDPLPQEADPIKLRRAREAANADIIICGGAPTPGARTVDRALFVWPGPAAGHHSQEATYAVINTETEPWQAQFLHAPY